MSDRAIRYFIIVLDAAPAIVRVRGEPMIFRSQEETVEYARLHEIARWMVYGDPDGWWPIYTHDGPVNLPHRRRSVSTSACTCEPCRRKSPTTVMVPRRCSFTASPRHRERAREIAPR